MRSLLSTTALSLWLMGFGVVSHAATEGYEVSAQEIKQETKQLVTMLQGYTAERRDDAFQAVEYALDDIDHNIDRLQLKMENSWRDLSESSREKMRSAMNELRKQRTTVAEWWGRMQESTADTWSNVKKGFSDAYGGLQSAWDNAVSTFQSSGADTKEGDSEQS